jgi:predicted transcriptional regulator
MPQTKVLTAHIPLSLAKKVDKLSKQMERPRAWIVKQALTSWVEWEEGKDRLTREALADVEAGRTVPHEKVVAWIDSLGTKNPLPMPRPKRARGR